MGNYHDEIPQSHFEWIKKQHMFFVATAPLNEHGHINVSPKGTADCFHVVNPKQVWYEDISGSGIETISHIRENGRITIMLCAFEGPPRIMRLWGIGSVHEYGSAEYNRLLPAASRKPGSRAAIVIDVHKVGTSCGFAVPLYNFVMHRTQLLRLCDMYEKGDRMLAARRDRLKGEQSSGQAGDGDDKELAPKLSIRKYWLFKNMRSLDGLPGLLTAADAMLKMTPQSDFDRDSTRPMLRHIRRDGHTTGDHRWFVLGFLLGAVTVFAATRLVDYLKA